MNRAQRRTRSQLARSHPVATAVAMQRMHQHMTTVSIAIYMTEDGAPARDLLSHLGWLIGIGAEIAAQRTPGMPQAKHLHASLRSVIQMGIANAWQASQAERLYTAANESKALLIANAAMAFEMIASADWLASRIRGGHAALADVAGAEIYSAQPDAGDAPEPADDGSQATAAETKGCRKGRLLT